jgi:hypothetical protein
MRHGDKMKQNKLIEIFENINLIKRIQNRLPYLFQLAEEESSRAGKIGMQVGSIRENIIIALLIYKFGQENIDINIPITEKEVDVKLYGEPISIKTITGKFLTGIKMIWTVDPISANEFMQNYKPECDMILIQINWNAVGNFYYIPLDSQKRCFNKLGRQTYIKLPKQGTNPRGVELSKDAVISLINDELTKTIEIHWKKSKIEYDAYRRWIDLWKKD